MTVPAASQLKGKHHEVASFWRTGLISEKALIPLLWSAVESPQSHPRHFQMKAIADLGGREKNVVEAKPKLEGKRDAAVDEIRSTKRSDRKKRV